MPLSQSQWSRIEDLFGRSIEGGPGTEDGLLREAADDPVVEAELRSLFAAAHDSREFQPVIVTLTGSSAEGAGDAGSSAPSMRAVAERKSP